MDVTALRSLATGVAFDTMGVDATVTPVGGVAVTTKGIWLQTPDEVMPVGYDFSRRESRRILALSVAALPLLPRGSVVVAAEPGGTVSRTWTVDNIDRKDGDQWRVVLAAA